MTYRALPEWIGRTPDTKVPPHVKLRIFDHYKGICHISGRKILVGELWDLDHIKALCNGGEHRESNLAPALRDKHKVKTAEDVAENSDVTTKRKKHILQKQSKFRKPPPGYNPWTRRIEQ